MLGFSAIELQWLSLIWARLLTVSLFLLQICLVYSVTKSFFGLLSARMVAVIYATSAGLIGYSHFLTADIPVTTWALASFYFAERVRRSGEALDYTAAGVFAGLAAATKYNGVVIAVAFVVAHLLAQRGPTIFATLFDRRLVLGIVMVPIAFMVGNPYSVLDASNFITDFMYNMVTTPVYEGVHTGHNYLGFFARIMEIVGLPTFVLWSVAGVLAVRLVLGGRLTQPALGGTIMLASVLLPYYAYFGSFERLPTRFVVPVIPYFLILGGAVVEPLPRLRLVVVAAVGGILIYNVICGALVGTRFLNDPRMAALSWMADNLPAGSSVEFSAHAPRPELVGQGTLVPVRLPFVSGRRRMFEVLLADEPWMWRGLDRIELADTSAYTPEALAARRPDFIAINSLYFERFLSGIAGQYYPEIKIYFQTLLRGDRGYMILFDCRTPAMQDWIYPSDIDFLDNRMVILGRSEALSAGSSARPAGPDCRHD
jgi:hypothetical protein